MDMRARTFPVPYRDQRVKRPDFPLLEAIGWYLADVQDELQPTTFVTYRSHLRRFDAWLPPAKRILASVEPETAEAYVRFTARNPNTRMNKMVALKSFATYLAKRKIWYAGTDELRLSVLRECRGPRPSAVGMPGYQPQELRAIERIVNDGANRLRNTAIIAVERHGFRSKEVRLLLRSNVVMPSLKGTRGHFIIDTEAGTKRGTGGVRIVPMSDAAKHSIQAYLRQERPEFRGDGPEPLFLTESGTTFSFHGWNQIQRRFRVACAREGIAFKQHRLRPTRAKELHEAGWTDSDIMEALGWKSVAMLRRYVGRVSVTHLKSLPEPMDTRTA
jgi:integrase